MKKIKPKVILGIILAILMVAAVLPACATLRSAVNGEVTTDGYSADLTKSESVSTTAAMASEGEIMTQEGGAPANNTGDYYAEGGTADYTKSIAASGKIIKTANIQLEVNKGEFEKKFFEIATLAEANNGFVSNSQSYSDSEGKLTSGMITIRVEQKNFDAVVNKIKQLGTVKSVQLGGTDVTQEYVDLESRLKNLQAQEQVLLELMKKSVKVTDSIEVQRELSNVQGEIEVIKGRMNYLDNMVSFSTIDISLAEPQAITESTEGGFLGAVKRGARGALTVVRGMTTVLIVMSPVLILIAIILIIIWQSLRARNRKRARQKT
ncbi:MAG: DUF4349 domain-containing protein [Actinobacteria bacterium]|nr:DUF4349 domain-containing protein [Actinomycetota bacterium]